MLIIPAIDLKKGRCVRLTEGKPDSERVYDEDPISVAKQFESDGAQLIHVIDLDAAFDGASENRRIIREIADAVDVPIEVGGGIRSIADIALLLKEARARHVILGTIAIEQPETLRSAVEQFGDAIVVGIDAKNDLVATRGWMESTPVKAVELARLVSSIGVRRIIFTDISRDGRLEGPNLEATRRIAVESGLSVTASGGVSSLDDIKSICLLERFGVDAVVVGKAIYEGRFSLGDAIAQANNA